MGSSSEKDGIPVVIQGRSEVFRFSYAHEGAVERAAEGASLYWGLVACSPQNIFIFRASEMPFPMFSWGKVHKSEHEKTLTIQIRK